MTLRDAENYLLALERFGMRFGLERMHRLMTVLGMPQRRFASIHVVGSNGKSSTARMIAAVLARHGLRTGTYTSPHLRSFTERIEVDERPLTGEELAGAVGAARAAAELVDRTAGDDEDRVTQFEALTAAAYHELARRRVEVAVVEAGLGGRYDATNVIPSKVQVVTSIDLEHTRWLGSTLAEIAEEKLDVVTPHGTVVTGELPVEAMAVAERVARERFAELIVAPGEGTAQLGLRGPFQRRNFALARAAAEAFHGPLDRSAVMRASQEVPLRGRLEVVAQEPLEVHDGAHNPAAARALALALPEMIGDRELTGVFAVLDDKDAAGILGSLLPRCRRAVLTRSANPRSLSPDALEAIARELGGPPCELAPDPRAAVQRARDLAGPHGAVLVTGSFYLLADLVGPAGAAVLSRL